MRIFRPIRDQNVEKGMFRNEELHNLYCSLNTDRMIKSIIFRCAGYAVGMEEDNGALLRGPGVDGRIIL